MIRPLLFATLLASPAVAWADPPAGQIDTTFGDGIGVPGLQLEGLDIGGQYEDYGQTMAEDSQGRLVLAGVGDSGNSKDCLGLMRFTRDGQLDKANFGIGADNLPGGKVCHAIPVVAGPARPMDVAMLDDDGFLVSGSAQDGHPFVCRFLPDGSLYEPFGGGTGCVILPLRRSDGESESPGLLIDGPSALVVTNDWPVPHDKSVPMLTRLDIATGAIQPAGQKDSIRLLSSEAMTFASDALFTTDGGLIVVGSVYHDADDVDAFIARFDLDTNAPDPAFSGDGMVRLKVNKVSKGTNTFSAATMTSEGNVLAVGSVELTAGWGISLMQVDAATGLMTASFNDGLPKTLNPCGTVDGGCGMWVGSTAAADDSIVVAGSLDSRMFALRLAADGAMDAAFGDDGMAVLSAAYAATAIVLQDERIVLGGSAKGPMGLDFALLRLSGGRVFNDQFERDQP